MEALPQNVSDDHLTVTLRNTQSKSSKNERENSLPIPVDLIIEIFSRLPFKSIGRCRCVSKHWGSILRRPDFTELFFSMALARPQLLFAYLIDSKLVFYSVPQPQNPNENSSPLAATYHMSLLSRISQSIEMWVLEDADKQEWSNHTYVLPASRQNVVHVRFAGVTRTNEILLTSYYIVPFYLLYYNMERKKIIRLQIQGMDVLPNNLVKTFLNYIEDVKLL
ncbi:unnamed protein product [Arabidopsis halleri]